MTDERDTILALKTKSNERTKRVGFGDVVLDAKKECDSSPGA